MSRFASLIPDGFDVATALQQLAGSEKLYLSILTKFYTLYQGLVETIAMDMQNGDMEKVQRDAHTVKGLAGTMGHGALRDAAAKLEKNAVPANLAECEAAFAEFKQVFERVLNSLKNAQSL